jgi:cytochrome c553
MNGLVRRCSCLIILLATGLNVCLADGQAGLQIPSASCEACHGAGGNKPVSPETPRLAGQEYDYLIAALLQYRNGARQNPIMGAMAKALDDAQIRDLAKYFSSQRGLTEKY